MSGVMLRSIVLLIVTGCLAAAGCDDLPKDQREKRASGAQEEILLSCHEGHGPNLTFAIRGDQAIVGYANGAKGTAIVVASPEQYVIQFSEGDYRVNRLNGQLTFWEHGAVGPSSYTPGECKQIGKRIGE